MDNVLSDEIFEFFLAYALRVLMCNSDLSAAENFRIKIIFTVRYIIDNRRRRRRNLAIQDKAFVKKRKNIVDTNHFICGRNI